MLDVFVHCALNCCLVSPEEKHAHRVSHQGVMPAVVMCLGERCGVLWARWGMSFGLIAAMRRRSFSVRKNWENTGVVSRQSSFRFATGPPNDFHFGLLDV